MKIILDKHYPRHYIISMNNNKGARTMTDSMLGTIAIIGDYLIPDSCNFGEMLKQDDGFSDSGFPGCQFRFPSIAGDLAVNIKVTSRKIRMHKGSYGWLRVEIEFVGDCEESHFCGGWLKPNSF